VNSPETEQFLSTLKDFQRDTVDYVFARMYEDPVPAMRYLIADEVGLGKTKVAAGIIARAVDRLKAKDPTLRIDVIYICSNSSIARQNINRLNVTRQPCHDLPDRITLLPRYIDRLRNNRVNFIAFTPGTSLSMRSSGGKAEERALLFWLLPDDWIANKKGCLSLLRVGMRWDRFKGRVDDFQSSYKIDEEIKRKFHEKLREELDAPGETGASLRERFIELADQLGGREKLSDQEAETRLEIICTLRSVLAGVCIESLEPDLIILDEFQRFSDLLHGKDEASQLAQQLFHYRDVRTLLLSATPYRMFTSADELEGDGHYTDLIKTIGFLLNDPERTRGFECALSKYGKELFHIGMDDGKALRLAREEVTEILRRVMVRTERLAVTSDRSGMLREVICPGMQVNEQDIVSFLALQKLARSLGVSDMTEYWKSAPYLVNFMDEYDIKRKLVDIIESSRIPEEVIQTLSIDQGTLFSKNDVSAYCELDPGNARLRNLVSDMLDCGAWKLLWVPPAWQHYKLEGEFAQPAIQNLTKRLIFSSWQVVPKVIAALLSYEAERRMLDIGSSGESGSQSTEARQKRRGLLRFNMASGRLTGMPVLGLLYPSFVLAGDIDPLKLATTNTASHTLKLQDVLEHASEVCKRLLEDITKSAPQAGDIDERWYWAAPILLDLNRDSENTKAWFGQANLADQWRGVEGTTQEYYSAEEDDSELEDAWAAHVRLARDLINSPITLGRPPKDLAEVLALNTVAGPAITALRALARVAGGFQRVTEKTIRNRAGQIAESFRSLFNQPEVTVMLRRANKEEPYWQRVLEYCTRGGLQAVLDEYAHILVEHLGVSGRPIEQIEHDICIAIRDSLTLRTATVAADSIEVDEREKVINIGEKIRFRTRFAVRFGARTQEVVQTVQRDGDVQKAFNSPFWPFVLCSTSVGQEGLDFHLYCHAVMHWNLPSNPVDLEQREGRIHRYKGHAVRKNVAKEFAANVTYSISGPKSDSWRQMFEAARNCRAAGLSDLIPFWVYIIKGGAHIERHLPMIPLSKDVERAEILRRLLAVYRMAFGQSRQDDLVQYLQRYLTDEQIGKAVTELRIDLMPDQSAERSKSGIDQTPGELMGEVHEVQSASPRIGLSDLEDLLDGFAEIQPERQAAPIEALERLLHDFSALRDV
jgi:hypothetical protein